jgi:hypothetical protein
MIMDLPAGLAETVDQMTGGMRDDLSRTEIALMCQAFLVAGIRLGLIESANGALCCETHLHEKCAYMEHAFGQIIDQVKPWIEMGKPNA